ncbi:MAG: monovalent cation/H+ antiporter complex subunit F [Chloroflexota bacterium]
MQQFVFYAATVWMTVLLGVCIAQLLVARSPATRILVLDTLTLILVALLALYSLFTRSYYYLDAALILALLSFVATLTAARYYGEGSPFA